MKEYVGQRNELTGELKVTVVGEDRRSRGGKKSSRVGGR